MIQPEFSTVKIGFIGAGNMAQSIALGLLKNHFPLSQLMLSSPSAEKPVLDSHNLAHTRDNRLLVQFADVILLATKPQQIARALAPLKPQLSGKCLISIVAGVTTNTLKKYLSKDCVVIRSMPNTPALIGEGITGLYSEASVRDRYGRIAESIFAAVGQWVWIEPEPLMNVVTAISGSGPGYFFLMIESLISAAEQQGLGTDVARQLAIQTMKGAAELLKNDPRTPTELRVAVTSPGGTTAAALASLKKAHYRQIIQQAVAAATRRGEQLAYQSRAEIGEHNS